MPQQLEPKCDQRHIPFPLDLSSHINLMPEILPTPPVTNIRKWIFVSIVCGIIFIIFALIVFMSGSGKTAAGKGFNPVSKEVSIWTFGMDSKTLTALNA